MSVAPILTRLPDLSHLRRKTARCLLRRGDEYLLAVHSSMWGKRNKRWGLPGGSIEMQETPEEAVRRELQEELHIDVGSMTDLGDFFYKRAQHRVLAAHFDGEIKRYDKTELLKIGWFSADQIYALERQRKLHAGYEGDALRTLLDWQD